MAMKAEDALMQARAYTRKSLEGMGALKGVDGEDGKSAYEIAKDNGFDGTEEEWLESLKGDGGSVEIVESVSHTSTNEQVLGAKAFYENYGRKFYDLGMWYVKKGMVNSTLDALLNSIKSTDRPVVISGFVDEGLQSLFDSIKTSIFGSTSVDMAWGVLSITVDALGAMEITYTLTHRKGIYLNSSIDGRLAGWTKLDNEDVLPLKGGYMSNGAYVIFGSDGGSSAKITSDEIMVDDADNNKTTSVTADGIETPSLTVDGKDVTQTVMDVLVDMHNLNENNSVTLSKGISNYKMLMFCMYTEHNNMAGNKVSAGTNTIPVSAFDINDQMLFASTFMSDEVFYLTAMGMGDKELNIENLSDHDSTVIATYVTIYGIK